MSKLAPARPRVSGRKQHFAIVASLFNRLYVQGLVDHAVAELRVDGVGEQAGEDLAVGGVVAGGAGEVGVPTVTA